MHGAAQLLDDDTHVDHAHTRPAVGLGHEQPRETELGQSLPYGVCRAAPVVEHVAPGRSNEARAPSDEELKATLVLALEIDQASAKIRSGPPQDFEHDIGLPIWAGVVPLRLVTGEPEPDPRLGGDIPLPAHVRTLAAGG